MKASDGTKEFSDNHIFENTDETTESMAINESARRLQEQLLQAEGDRQNGKQGYSVEQVSRMMRDAIVEVANGSVSGALHE
jgi:hypothetical protein